MEQQKMDWGYVEWFSPPGDDPVKGKVTVGITNVNPHVIQKAHRHYGNAQVLYVIEGEGYYRINGHTHTIVPGQFYFVPTNGQHQTVNTGSYPIREVVVSVPMQFIKEEISPISLRESSLEEAVRTLDLETLADDGFPLMIVDMEDQVLIASKEFPTCLQQREAGGFGLCDCWKKGRNYKKYVCNSGRVIFNIPILENGVQIGWIHGGFIGEENVSTGVNLQGVLSRSTETAIEEFLDQIAEGISEYVKYQKMRSRIAAKDEMIRTKNSDIERISDVLLEEKQKSTNLRINHHFLFNILNHFASLALTGERTDLYEGIIDLSAMLRYSSRTEFSEITLKEELDFVAIYLRLQQRRYRDGMKIIVDVSPKHYSQCVPINFLQPIVENAFTHGFMEYSGEKEIIIKSEIIDNKFTLLIKNNGTPIDMVTISRVNHLLPSNTGHALNLIYEKFRLIYGSHFSMSIGEEEGMTIVRLSFAWRDNV